MLTPERIKADFSKITALTGNSVVYHNTAVFDGHGTFCDVYFQCVAKEVTAQQAEVYNQFVNTYKSFEQEIECFLSKSLSPSENRMADEIQKSTLYFEVIDVPFDPGNYDLVLVCSKTYKRFLFFKKDITLRVEFEKGKIKSMQRKKDTLKENINRGI